MISIREVAELAGVSAATVSRVMNGTAKVDPKKRERVLRVIEETGFIPNEVARTLFRKSAKTIGPIVPSIRNPYFTELAAHIDTMALQHGYRPFLCNTGYDPEKEKAAVQMLVSMNADAIIIASCSEYVREIINKCPITNIVHALNPFHLIFCFELLGDTFLLSQLLHQPIKHFC